MLQVYSRWTSTTVPHDFVIFFICNIEKPIYCCIPAKKSHYNLTKNKFQATVTERCILPVIVWEYFATNALKVPVNKLNLQTDFTTHEPFYKRLLRFPERFSYQYTEACLYHWQTYFVFVFVFVKSIPLHFYYSLDEKRNKNKS